MSSKAALAIVAVLIGVLVVIVVFAGKSTPPAASPKVVEQAPPSQKQAVSFVTWANYVSRCGVEEQSNAEADANQVRGKKRLEEIRRTYEERYHGKHVRWQGKVLQVCQEFNSSVIILQMDNSRVELDSQLYLSVSGGAKVDDIDIGSVVAFVCKLTQQGSPYLDHREVSLTKIDVSRDLKPSSGLSRPGEATRIEKVEGGIKPHRAQWIEWSDVEDLPALPEIKQKPDGWLDVKYDKWQDITIVNTRLSNGIRFSCGHKGKQPAAAAGWIVDISPPVAKWIIDGELKDSPQLIASSGNIDFARLLICSSSVEFKDKRGNEGVLTAENAKDLAAILLHLGRKISCDPEPEPIDLSEDYPATEGLVDKPLSAEEDRLMREELGATLTVRSEIDGARAAVRTRLSRAEDASDAECDAANRSVGTVLVPFGSGKMRVTDGRAAKAAHQRIRASRARLASIRQELGGASSTIAACEACIIAAHQVDVYARYQQMKRAAMAAKRAELSLKKARNYESTDQVARQILTVTHNEFASMVNEHGKALLWDSAPLLPQDRTRQPPTLFERPQRAMQEGLVVNDVIQDTATRPAPPDPNIKYIVTEFGAMYHRPECRIVQAMNPSDRIEVTANKLGNKKACPRCCE